MQGRVAGAPICWAVRELPGWGHELPGLPRDEGPLRAVRESLSYLGGLFGGQQ